MKGEVELGTNITLNLKNYESLKVNISFREEYDSSIEGARENKYYELLEAVQCRLMEAVEETKKTFDAMKK